MRFAKMNHRTNPEPRSGRRGLTACALVLLWLTPALTKAQAQDLAPSQRQPEHHKFTAYSAGRGMPTKGALEAAFDTWRSEDGTLVVRTQEWYKTASDARNALDKLISSASRVIKQDTKKDPKGNLIGERVELLFTGKDKASTRMVIAWTDGAKVIRLGSESLPLLLDFESQAYP